MIQRLITIRNVGLLSSISAPVDFARVTLVYGENGRGKSTLSWLLRVASLKEASQMKAKATFGADGSQEVGILFSAAGGNKQCHFKDGCWTCELPGIDVFDSVFVDDNVYSGMAVDTRQRQQLLDFMLGEEPVTMKRRIEDLAAQSRKAASEKSAAVESLRGYADPIPVYDYVNVTVPSEIDAQIERASRQLQEARDADAFLSRSRPKPPQQLDFLSVDLRRLARTTIEDLNVAAESRVRLHIGKRGAHMEPWLKAGLEFCSDEGCPFCGQIVDADSIVYTYRAFFNEEYAQLKADLDDLAKRLRSRTSAEKLDFVLGLVESNNEILQSWAPHLQLAPDMLEDEDIRSAWTHVAEVAEAILTAKLNSPLDAIETILLDDFDRAVTALNYSLDPYRASIRAKLAEIVAFLESVRRCDLNRLQRELKKLEAIKKRALPEVDELTNQFKQASNDHVRINKEKTRLKNQLTCEAPKVIRPYVDAINSLLKEFGADFELYGVRQSNPGGKPTVDYKLKVRGSEVELGSRDAARTSPCFGSALSDGDKRTLALAFFLAKVGADDHLSEKVLVVDDPMSSLDRHRQRKTIEALADLAERSKQLIVLSHDPGSLPRSENALSRKHHGIDQ
jgi:wobble nucleotide-excising tRNase